jgi:ferredoxin
MPSDKTVLLCSCERTMPRPAEAVARGCGAQVVEADQLCGAELDRFRAALAGGGLIAVGCVLKAPLFQEVAEEEGFAGSLVFPNLREGAGWSDQAADAGPKAAAMAAAAMVAAPPVALTAAKSEGVALILGSDEAAVEAAEGLADHLNVTVLLTPGADVMTPRQADFPVMQGRARNAVGSLGKFEVFIDIFAAPLPSSRGALRFGPSRDGAVSSCDLIIDMTGGQPLFPEGLRDGYLRADPRSPTAVARAVLEASQLVGEFDRPRFISFDAGLCAHNRSRITGCTRCLNLCPAGAITSGRNSVIIDPDICAGCGQCAAACPTGAASYALPPSETLVSRLRAAMRGWREAGGAADALIMLHDQRHGGPLIHALAHHGSGLPARAIPIEVNEITQVGPEVLAAALAFGAAQVRLLAPARPRHDIAGLRSTLTLTEGIARTLGYGERAVGLIESDDPDALRALLDAVSAAPARPAPADFLPPAARRPLMTTAFEALGRAAPASVERIDLPPGAPFGGVALDDAACTLCLSCVSACPAAALVDNPDAPMLRFDEKLCVQCGLCEATCPETAITLTPRIDFAAWAEGPVTLKQEPPFCCVECGKPFGTRAAIEKVREKLSDHWMFRGPEGEARARALEMCEDCRIGASLKEGLDPYGAPQRTVRTTDDYLRERKT